MDAPTNGARGGARGGRGRGGFGRGGGPGSQPPRGPASDRPRGQGGSGAMRGNPRRDPVGSRPRAVPAAQFPKGGPGGPHVNEGPTVEARVYGWRESKASAEECVAFLERKSRLKFKKVRLIIRARALCRVFALSSPSSAASFCGYTFLSFSSSFCAPGMAVFFLYYSSREISEMVRDFWRLPRYYQRIVIAWVIMGMNTKYPSHSRKDKKALQTFQTKSSLVRKPRNEATEAELMPMISKPFKPASPFLYRNKHHICSEQLTKAAPLFLPPSRLLNKATALSSTSPSASSTPSSNGTTPSSPPHTSKSPPQTSPTSSPPSGHAAMSLPQRPQKTAPQSTP